MTTSWVLSTEKVCQEERAATETGAVTCSERRFRFIAGTEHRLADCTLTKCHSVGVLSRRPAVRPVTHHQTRRPLNPSWAPPGLAGVKQTSNYGELVTPPR